jgi:hypothetical protein
VLGAGFKSARGASIQSHLNEVDGKWAWGAVGERGGSLRVWKGYRQRNAYRVRI